MARRDDPVVHPSVLEGTIRLKHRLFDQIRLNLLSPGYSELPHFFCRPSRKAPFCGHQATYDTFLCGKFLLLGGTIWPELACPSLREA